MYSLLTSYYTEQREIQLPLQNMMTPVSKLEMLHIFSLPGKVLEQLIGSLTIKVRLADGINVMGNQQ